MPSININFLNKLKVSYKDYNNFIETGTFMGETIFEMEKYFDKLYTIEIKEEYYNNLIEKYKGNKINFKLGSSEKVLKEILSNIRGKSIFFLDGHWSAGTTGKGEKDVPLYEEITNIKNLHNEECIIIVDDVRMFGKGPNKKGKKKDICNWENINVKSILEIINERLEKYYYLSSNLEKNDRLVIHVKK